MGDVDPEAFARFLPCRPLAWEDLEGLQGGLGEDIVTVQDEDDPEQIVAFAFAVGAEVESYRFDADQECWSPAEERPP